MRHPLISILATILLAGLLSAAPPDAKKQPAFLCKLTGKKIEKCCCEKRGEKLYCTLAKKTIDKCCCEPAGTPKEKKAS